MAEIVNCPQCERKLRVPDELLGRSVKCPTCGITFPATPGMGTPVPPGEGTPLPPVPTELMRQPDADYGHHSRWGERERPVGEDREAIMAMVRPPAICLLIAGILGLLVDGVSAFLALIMPPQAPRANYPQWLTDIMEASRGPTAAATSALFALASLFVIIAAIFMLSGRARGLALAGSIVAMVNIGNCCCLLGLPFGIWALVVLLRPEVAAVFDSRGRGPMV